jgi:hypothetical protein
MSHKEVARLSFFDPTWTTGDMKASEIVCDIVIHVLYGVRDDGVTPAVTIVPQIVTLQQLISCGWNTMLEQSVKETMHLHGCRFNRAYMQEVLVVAAELCKKGSASLSQTRSCYFHLGQLQDGKVETVRPVE